ncbi:MAG TPA: FAD-binding oxidoreductase [Candidatus Saccharimonadales bacterium]|nr:FAD-binding oxidoreductase [Candidatus Saccharimonadales bacterium]
MTPTDAPITESSTWFVATTKAIRAETPTVKTFTFEAPHKIEHSAGQHYEIRLTAPNGYQAARLYSAATAANNTNLLELTVALVPAGEVTPYLCNQLKIGEDIEIRGPLGKSFIWQPSMREPLLLIAGGSGVVPMRCIIQAHTLTGSKTPVYLLYGARSQSDIIYSAEFAAGSPHVTTKIVLSDSWPEHWPGETGFITPELITQALHALPKDPRVFICGATPFVELMADDLVKLGVPPAHIRAERFG